MVLFFISNIYSNIKHHQTKTSNRSSPAQKCKLKMHQTGSATKKIPGTKKRAPITVMQVNLGLMYVSVVWSVIPLTTWGIYGTKWGIFQSLQNGVISPGNKTTLFGWVTGGYFTPISGLIAGSFIMIGQLTPPLINLSPLRNKGLP